MSSSSAAVDQEEDKPMKVACIGGGQLGRMMALEAPRIDVEMSFLDPSGVNCPAGKVVPSSSNNNNRIIQGNLNDATKIKELASHADIITVEIEHVNVEALAEIEKEGEKDNNSVKVRPSSRVLRTIKDKLLQKQHFAGHNIPVPEFRSTSSIDEIKTACQELGLPLMLKSRFGGYDGRGNAVLRSCDDESIRVALNDLGVDSSSSTSTSSFDLYAEGWIHFDCEVAVMVVRSCLSNSDDDNNNDNTNKTAAYPCVNAVQQDSICRVVLAPARNVSESARIEAEKLAIRAIDSFGDGACGVFGVEMFVVSSDGSSSSNGHHQQQQRVLLNEVAPRPHNTGHYTQNACAVSQFENHLRAVCGMPLGPTNMVVESAAMVNVLGAKSGRMNDTRRSTEVALTLPNTSVHWYSKSCRPGRKMAHINIVGNSHGEVDLGLRTIMEAEGIPASLIPSRTTAKAAAATTPLVGVIMGSQSDLPTMNAACDILKRFGIPHEVDIVSAHRTPEKLMEYSRGAASRGIRVIIAGAGGAAHLPGMVAAMTPLPVIGVPVKTSTLSGVDSLYSIVQMPRGVPVATVAIGNSTNAGLLAVRILSTSRQHLRKKMLEYQNEMKDTVDDMSARLLELGSDDFLSKLDNQSKSVNV